MDKVKVAIAAFLLLNAFMLMMTVEYCLFFSCASVLSTIISRLEIYISMNILTVMAIIAVFLIK